MSFSGFQFTHPGKGATGDVAPIRPHPICFNSRTLGRVRHNSNSFIRASPAFQFTHPGKGATFWCDKTATLTAITGSGFNSRTLGRVRLNTTFWRCLYSVVSIHAPWEGCDLIDTQITKEYFEFQFTHPGKGATLLNPIQISISDKFQFTHPGKGATKHIRTRNGAAQFQFTHPGKGATTKYLNTQSDKTVSIHAPWEGCDRC